MTPTALHVAAAGLGTLLPALVLAAVAGGALAAEHDPLAGAPEAVVDLATPAGIALMQAQWRYSDTRLTQIAFRAPGSDGQPTGPDSQTYDFLPKAGARDYDDSGWEQIDPGTLSRPRGHGHLSFNWYRVRLTVPPRVGELDPTGSTLVFETQVDDYA
ncbi:MAG TPA: hypothetical protein VD791_00245, partial [Burkholderiales bacterium]|nr:hypothetical protein [Burkholderiales bacterium]